MKKIGGSVGAMTAIAKGEKPYDADAVKAALTTISETAKVFPDQFKPGTETGDKVASPKIWENLADFKSRADKLSSDAETLLAQLPADAAGVGGALKTLGGNCGGCHQNYRLKE
jgi:cytochrome c556